MDVIAETWTSDECAEHWGVKTTTWLGYVSRGQAPAPLAGIDGRRKRWDADEVRAFPRPGAGRSRAGAGGEAEALLARMREVAAQDPPSREQQKELLATGREQGLEISAMARALGVSRRTAHTWLGA
ncbi:hypothetical protein EV383_4021 [Pseudonocardia sediminis]|uniref:Helix-turn-helix protein n=1 Tax=Pseudonocardia sediminis TaxID=1397368 RepID=A0A4Q7V373_PSEST|nr:hypothetical protein [Pseudonocardia sediminis]RZT87113.1 hypothetical protein EV383_4021 [Pseudonocardia sediminis]